MSLTFHVPQSNPKNLPHVGRYISQVSEQSSYDGEAFHNNQPQHIQGTNIRQSSVVVYSTVPRANSRIDENNNKKPPPPPPMPPSQPNTPMSTLRSQKSVENSYQRQQSTACKAELHNFYVFL